MPFNLQKPFKAQVSIMSIHNNKFKVDFRLVSGNSKRFVRTCQKIQVTLTNTLETYPFQQYLERPKGQPIDDNMNISSDLCMYSAQLKQMCDDLRSQPVKQRPI